MHNATIDIKAPESRLSRFPSSVSRWVGPCWPAPRERTAADAHGCSVFGVYSTFGACSVRRVFTVDSKAVVLILVVICALLAKASVWFCVNRDLVTFCGGGQLVWALD